MTMLRFMVLGSCIMGLSGFSDRVLGMDPQPKNLEFLL